MKGIIAMKCDDQRFAVQAVRMRLEGVPSVRGNRMKARRSSRVHRKGSFGRLVLLAPTWCGPLPIMMNGRRPRACAQVPPIQQRHSLHIQQQTLQAHLHFSVRKRAASIILQQSFRKRT